MRLLIPLLIIVPALEIGLFILSGKTIGIIPTMLLIIITGFLGAYLAKKQGTKVFREAQLQMSYGQLPGDSILEGLCILIGAVFLLSPGFLTDVLGLTLLLPTTRIQYKKMMKKWLEQRMRNGQFYYIRR